VKKITFIFFVIVGTNEYNLRTKITRSMIYSTYIKEFKCSL